MNVNMVNSKLHCGIKRGTGCLSSEPTRKKFHHPDAPCGPTPVTTYSIWLRFGSQASPNPGSGTHGPCHLEQTTELLCVSFFIRKMNNNNA